VAPAWFKLGEGCWAPIALRESWDNSESNHLHRYDELKDKRSRDVMVNV
jgi:hypothetical protein